MDAHHSLGSGELRRFFSPETVAIVGATDKEGSVGATLTANLLNSKALKGKVFPINPKRKELLNVPCHPSILEVPESIHLAVIIVPAKFVPQVIRECVEKGVESVIIISAGFKEVGEEGAKLESEILEIIKGTPLRIIGPNCLGLMYTPSELNATFAATTANPGSIGFISQSGAMCTAVLDWSMEKNVGFSAFVSIGSMLDVDWGDLIEFLGDDPHTDAILIYMESIGNARSFLRAAKKVSRKKPIILIKGGRSDLAAQAILSHTGTLAGSHDNFIAAMKSAGVILADSIGEFFNLTEFVAKQAIPDGSNICILTNAGGPGVLATDAIDQFQSTIAQIDEKTIKKLDEKLPAAWSRSNPVDVLGDALADRYEAALEALYEDPASDSILVILSPQDMTDPTGTAKAMLDISKNSKKPMIASFMGGAFVKEGAEMLGQGNIPCYPYPDSGVQVLSEFFHYKKQIDRLDQPPRICDQLATQLPSKERKSGVDHIFTLAAREGRTLLSEFESKEVLTLYGIPTCQTRKCLSLEEAVKAANDIPFPLVVKLQSETITHKSDVGGVKLHINSVEEVEKAYKEIEESVTKLCGKEHFGGVTVQQMITSKGYEVILGSTLDSQFGPMLLFGSGGTLVEIYKDAALGLPPLNETTATQVLEETKIFHALQGTRGEKSADINLLKQILIAFSILIAENPRIKECDINPLLAGPEEIIALDARIVLHDHSIPAHELPKPATPPYPYDQIYNCKEMEMAPSRLENLPDILKWMKGLKSEEQWMVRVGDDPIESKALLLATPSYDRALYWLIWKGGNIEGAVLLDYSCDQHVGRIKLIHATDEAYEKALGFCSSHGIEHIECVTLKGDESLQATIEKHGFSKGNTKCDAITVWQKTL
ncbi:MAG: Peptidyl-lysine N-acetyltransferase Pat [Chlamydiia bacterium]|nr:Peptidyl-lysine N-acetyltransferase Pat [Chlamydiia bacterium]